MDEETQFRYMHTFSCLGDYHWFGIHTFPYCRIRYSRHFLHKKHRKKFGELKFVRHKHISL